MLQIQQSQMTPVAGMKFLAMQQQMCWRVEAGSGLVLKYAISGMRCSLFTTRFSTTERVLGRRLRHQISGVLR